ncbi:hypothetical protein F5X98DRAFT_340855 [Xylaria grammica]|nr:hypothetical protein F5X98DRAFT_340855 [Xylaria grammica]
MSVGELQTYSAPFHNTEGSPCRCTTHSAAPSVSKPAGGLLVQLYIRNYAHTPICEQCSEFGGYLYLRTNKRVCFLCFSENLLYWLPPLPLGRASRKFGLQRRIIERLPRMKAITGKYSRNEREVAWRSTIVDYESALRSGVVFYESLDVMFNYVSDAEVMRDSGSAGHRSRRPRVTGPFE